MKSAPITPSHGAAQVSVLKKVVGMMFWICGVPGSASIVKVKAPSAMVAGNQPLRNAALPEHLRGEGVDGEHDDEERHAAVGEERAHQHDRQHGVAAPDQADHRGDDRAREAGELDHLAEHRAEQEHRQVGLDEADHLVHEHAAEHRRHERGVGEKHGEQRADRREQDDAEAAVGDEHQERERERAR